jgi:hypothetical protein
VITGYNTDVKHDGKTFHVQTEDKGAGNPIIETLVYISGGRIIASKQYNYASLVVDGKAEERAVLELLESQHRRVMRWIAGGKFDEAGPPPFGATIISDRSFDEVALDFLRALEGAEPIEIVLVDDYRAVAGTTGPIKILVRSEVSNGAIATAQVAITLNPPSGSPVRLLAGAAGPDGTMGGKIKIPVDASGGTLHMEARHGGLVGTLDVTIAAP